MSHRTVPIVRPPTSESVGGSLDANIARWKSQFSDVNGRPAAAKIDGFSMSEAGVLACNAYQLMSSSAMSLGSSMR